ncbi:MAG: MaoC family dehydratase N-terminal domain-containing protein [Rhodobiaceae bacterium]|nr:MaoC family dehydratase N-terminal domain-containing protein [Rhodobiaceae bacterium]MCC0014046.1 MaoC family dehydratase N-terminal domain-containing protein [Rhodobiaceae bacterium]MCC0051024.1 MaoC family dehydratase N-terminal domain-containing protein [Rhodobiaceae bacterium]MCC0060383.1 MaoC family dehydratase N-terminal domain-containing protein [Rhodobiaceae bacterium]
MSEPDLTDWIGNRESASDIVTPAKAAGMAALFDWPDAAAPGTGDPLPALWHWMFFAPSARQSEIGPDGHPARGGFMPPVPLPRRMFAGATMRFHDAIRVGDTITRDSEILSVEEKQGRTGPLVFVRVRHAVSTATGLALEDEHTIVYREESSEAPPPPPQAQLDAIPWRRQYRPDPVWLFRYSALTFNAHRIHYDREYATGVEGYPGLVVHGPLIATCLAELARAETKGRPLKTFSFRAVSPLFDISAFTVAGAMNAAGDGCDLQAVNGEGGIAMQAKATFA